MKRTVLPTSGRQEKAGLISESTINSALIVENWEVIEECTQSDHNLILFDLRIQGNKNLNRMDSDFTRKFATKVGNWNLFELKVKQCSQQWREWVNSATTKETLGKSITGIWSKLGEIGKVFPPIPTKKQIRSMVVTEVKRVKKTSKCFKTQS